jgi:hypothetical protein
MPIPVVCPRCDTKLHAADDATGRKTKCPVCGTVCVIPSDVYVVTEPAREEGEGSLRELVDARAARPVLPPMCNQLPVKSKIQEAWRELQLIRLRQAARRTLDVTCFGNNAAGRLCSALLLATAMFFAAFFLAKLADLELVYMIAFGVGAFVVVMTICAAVVLGTPHEELEELGDAWTIELSHLKEKAEEEPALREFTDEEECAAREAERLRAQRKERQAKEAASKPEPTTKRCPFCAEEILYQAVKCKHCGEMLDEPQRIGRQRRPRSARAGQSAIDGVKSQGAPAPSKKKKTGQVAQPLAGAAGCLTIIVLVAACVGLFNSGGKESSPTGQTEILRGRDGRDVPVAISQQAHDRFVTLVAAKDHLGLGLMAEAGLVWSVPSGTECVVIDRGILSSEVRIMEGKHTGQACFVSSDFIVRK